MVLNDEYYSAPRQNNKASFLFYTNNTLTLLSGVDATVCGCTALLLSGWLIKRFRLKIRAMLKMCLVSHIVCGVCLFAIFLRCDNTSLAGVITPYATFAINS